MRLRTVFGGGCAVLLAAGMIAHERPTYFVGVLFWGGMALIFTAIIVFFVSRARH